MLTIRLFGTGEAKYFDRQLHGFPYHKACLLFCYLLINRKSPQTREKIAAAFWGDSSGLTARKNLRHALWDLRQTLQSAGALPDDYLLSSENHIMFLNSGDYWLDIEVFEAAIDSCQFLSGEEISEECASRLEEAVDLYTGDLLESNYEDWCLYDREWLRSLYLKALSKLLRFHSITGDYERGLYYGHRLLAKEPTSELVHRQVICLHWLLGDRTSALAQYHHCRQILRDELGVSPMEETRQLFEQMKGGQVDTIGQVMQYTLGLSPRYDKAKKQALSSEYLLDKLHKLQQTIEKSRIELRQLEQLIHQSFPGSQ